MTDDPRREGATASGELGTFAAFGEFDDRIQSAQAVGVDSGSSLVKIALRADDDGLHFATFLAPAKERVLTLLRDLTPDRIGLTGSGSADLAGALGRAKTPIPSEFEAWARGARAMLQHLSAGRPPAGGGRADGRTNPPADGRPGASVETPQAAGGGKRDGEAPFLLVSVGTGTSIMRVEGDRVERIAGTSIGGGTLLGLASAMTEIKSHADLVEAAARGERGQVDLLIRDVYGPDAGIPLPGEAVASSFGKLARAVATPDPNDGRSSDEDRAAAILGLVSEIVGFLATAHASAAGVSRVVYGGSTLLGNPQMAAGLQVLGAMSGVESIVLPHSGHAGALGAMLLGD